MCQISLWISFSCVFCGFNCVASRNKSKSTINVRSSFEISPQEILVSYSSSTYVNENMSFPNSNFEGNFISYVFGKEFLHYRELKIDCWASRHIMEKNIKYFRKCGCRILVENWNIYEAHNFPRPFLETCSFETTSLFLNTLLRVNKFIQILIIFIEINVNFCLLYAQPVMKSIMLHTRRPNCQ